METKKEIEGKKTEVGGGGIISYGGHIINWYMKLAEGVSKYGFFTFLKTLFIIAVTIIFIVFVNALINQNYIESILERNKKEYEYQLQLKEFNHLNGSMIRRDIQPKISNVLIRMVYELGADRASILEMHNGKENPTSLPFEYCDMTYEEPREGKRYVSEQYQNMNMGHYSFPAYLKEKKFFFGSVDSIYDFDRKIAISMEDNNVKYAAIMLIRTNIEIGFLIVSFEKEPKVDKSQIYCKLYDYVQEVNILLDYSKQSDKISKQLINEQIK